MRLRTGIRAVATDPDPGSTPAFQRIASSRQAKCRWQMELLDEARKPAFKIRRTAVSLGRVASLTVPLRASAFVPQAPAGDHRFES
jgi:hypothetical protein